MHPGISAQRGIYPSSEDVKIDGKLSKGSEFELAEGFSERLKVGVEWTAADEVFIGLRAIEVSVKRLADLRRELVEVGWKVYDAVVTVVNEPPNCFGE